MYMPILSLFRSTLGMSRLISWLNEFRKTLNFSQFVLSNLYIKVYDLALHLSFRKFFPLSTSSKGTREKYNAFLNSFYLEVKWLKWRLEQIKDKKSSHEKAVQFNQVYCDTMLGIRCVSVSGCQSDDPFDCFGTKLTQRARSPTRPEVDKGRKFRERPVRQSAEGSRRRLLGPVDLQMPGWPTREDGSAFLVALWTFRENTHAIVCKYTESCTQVSLTSPTLSLYIYIFAAFYVLTVCKQKLYLCLNCLK